MRAYLCAGCAKMSRDYLNSSIVNTKRFCPSCSEGLRADLSKGALRACDANWREFEMFFGRRKAHSFRNYSEMEREAKRLGFTPIGSKGGKPDFDKIRERNDKEQDERYTREMLKEWEKANTIEL